MRISRNWMRIEEERSRLERERESPNPEEDHLLEARRNLA
jgi:hypothetical protein